MTDQDLIQLVRQKTPDEFTAAELTRLRQRLNESADLRAALAGQLLLESRLAQVLGNVGFSVDAILARQPSTAGARESLTLPLVGIAAALLLLGLMAAVIVNSMRTPANSVDGEQRITFESSIRPKIQSNDSQLESTATDTKRPVPNNDSPPTVPDPQPTPPTEGENSVASDPPPPAELPLTIEAESFARGNVQIDSDEFGTKEITVIRSDASPSFAEYDVDLAAAASLRLKLRYASFDSRPLTLKINGHELATIAGEQTGGHFSDRQKWFTVGPYEFAQGKNTIRLETLAKFPQLDQFVVTAESPPEPVAAVVTPPSVPSGALPVPPKAPWHDVIASADEPPALADICFAEFDTAKSLPQPDDLQQWFDPVAGQLQKIFRQRTKLGECGAFEGLLRLKAPWTNDSALRMALEDYNRMRIHLFSGEVGVTLAYYENENFRWTGYQTTRQPGEPKPERFFLTATDEGRCLHTEIRFGGPFEIRHHDGEVILSRGDVVLLRAPLAAAPTDVYFEGRAAFQGIALVRSKDFPAREPPPSIVADVPQPANLNWSEHLSEGTRLERLADGAIQLIADGVKQRAWISTPLTAAGVHEVVLQLDDVTVGAGVFLGREGQPPREVVRILKNQRDGQMCISLRGDDDSAQADFGAIHERVVPFAGSQIWVRLLFGCGTLRWWASSDGVHWAAAEEPRSYLAGGITRVGLHCVANQAACRITLRRITWRRLDQFAALDDGQLLNQVPPLPDNRMETWITAVTQSQPADADVGAWRRACALRTLGAGCNRELGNLLVALLLDDAAARKLPAEQQLALLNESALLCDLDNNTLLATVQRYYELGLSLYREQDERPYSFVRHALMTAPIATRPNYRVAGEDAIRVELIQLLAAGKWNETVEFCRQLKFFQQHQQAPLVDWAETTALRELPRRTGSELVASRREDWRQPLEEELSKEAYNVLAELQAVLDSEAYEDAARSLAALEPSVFTGVAPHAVDRQLLVSLPAAIRLAMRDYPELERVINNRFGPLAQLRVRQAIAAADVAAVELAAVQFAALPAAAEARQWLGDRALSSGWFARALAEYHRAEKTAGRLQKPELAARIRLAAAMLGQDVGTPVTWTVSFGETRLAAAEFESLVGEMRGRAGNPDQQAVAQDDALPSFLAPPPTGFEIQRRSRLDGSAGEDPNAEITRHVQRLKVDWVDRQLAVVVDGDVAFVSNRFQLAAYDLQTGQRKWQSPRPPGKMLRSQDWTMTAMRPLITGPRIIVRQLYEQGPMLVCLDKNSGQIVWTAKQTPEEFLVSDPLLIQDQLVGLTILKTDQRQHLLRLTQFAPDTGEVLGQRELLRLRESWWTRRYCAVTPLADALVANLGGVTLCCDVSGQLRWVRQQLVLPTEEESTWVTQFFDRPLLNAGRLYIAQPGVRQIACLDPDTGSQYWQSVLPDVQRFVGIVGGRLIVRAADGILALDLNTGNVAWRHAATDLLDAQLCGGAGGVVYSRRQAVDGNPNNKRPRLVWLDPATGQQRASTDLTGLEDGDPRLGPLISYHDRLWTFFGRGQNDPNRDVVELIPKGAAATKWPLAAAPDKWLRHIALPLHQAAADVLPQWQLLSARDGDQTGLVSDAWGEKDVVCLRSSQDIPVVWGRMLRIPQSGTAKLRLRVANDAQQIWKLRVKLGDELIWESELNDQTQPDRWKQFDVDLSQLAGRQGWLTVTCQHEAGGDQRKVFWKLLEVVL